MPRRGFLKSDGRGVMTDYYIGREYQDWLVRMMDLHGHLRLFKILYEIEFVWSHPFDENRAEDGINLRYRFSQDEFDSAGRNVGRDRFGHEYRDSMEDIPCSVLEMLIALAVNFEDSIMYDPAEGDRSKAWFWLMLDNLGIAEYSDKYLARLNRNGYRRVCEAIIGSVNVFMHREYGYDGKGGLFPLRRPRTDQREEEIWYQANIYAMEELGL